MVKVYVANNGNLELLDTVANVDYALKELCEKVSLTYDRVENSQDMYSKVSKYYYKNELKAMVETIA